MQSGYEFHLDGPEAAEIRMRLGSELTSPIFVTTDDEQQAEFMLVPKYVECYRWYPHGTIDTTLGRSVADLGLIDFRARIQNCLKSAGIITIGDLAKTTEQQLLDMPYLGPKLVAELKRALAHYGLELSE